MNFLTDTRFTAAMRLFLYNGSASIGTIIGVVAIVFLVGVQIATLFGVIDISSNVIRHSGVDFWRQGRKLRRRLHRLFAARQEQGCWPDRRRAGGAKALHADRGRV